MFPKPPFYDSMNKLDIISYRQSREVKIRELTSFPTELPMHKHSDRLAFVLKAVGQL
jgi:hypothetical protein